MKYLSFIKEKLKITVRFILTSLGIELHKNSEDRLVLEEIIFPALNSLNELNRILFVGCQWYTKIYNKIFKEKDYYTMDINPKTKKYGAKKHIIDSLENVCKYFDEGKLDLIICNGVWGWGLNDRSQTEIAFQACYKCLRKGGIFLLGWDDIPEYRPFPLDICESLKLFKPFVFKPLSTSQYLTSTTYRHTYNFFTKI
jgi:SAM-dependent methyltransferase